MNTKRKKNKNEALNLDPFQEIILEQMKSQNWEQPDLVKATGISQPTIYRILTEPNYYLKTKVQKIISICESLKIPCPHNGNFLDQKIVSQLYDLCDEDKKTLLRIILRMKNSPETTADLLQHILKSIQS